MKKPKPYTATARSAARIRNMHERRAAEAKKLVVKKLARGPFDLTRAEKQALAEAMRQAYLATPYRVVDWPNIVAVAIAYLKARAGRQA